MSLTNKTLLGQQQVAPLTLPFVFPLLKPKQADSSNRLDSPIHCGYSLALRVKVKLTLL